MLNPPVCKIMDMGKYKYDLQKKVNLAKKKQKVVSLKEIKLRPGTEIMITISKLKMQKNLYLKETKLNLQSNLKVEKCNIRS